MRFIAMRFGAQTVLSGLTSAQFVVIPAAGYLLLGEPVTLSSVAGILVILLGMSSIGCLTSTNPGIWVVHRLLH